MLSQLKQVLCLSSDCVLTTLSRAVYQHISIKFCVCLQDCAIILFEQYAVTIQTSFVFVFRLCTDHFEQYISTFQSSFVLSSGLCSDPLWAVCYHSSNTFCVCLQDYAVSRFEQYFKLKEQLPAMLRADLWWRERSSVLRKWHVVTCPPFRCMLGGSPECQAVCTPMWIDPVLCSDTDSAIVPG